MNINIWWIRRDLRLDHNPTLNKAKQKPGLLLPLFIIDPILKKTPPTPRQDFLFSGLKELHLDLQKHGSRLVILQGEPPSVFTNLKLKFPNLEVFAEEDYSPYARNRDSQIQKLIPLHLVSGLLIQHPEYVRKKDGSPYSTFTPFSRTWKGLPTPPLPGKLTTPLPPCPDLDSLPLPKNKNPDHFPPGESEAQRRLSKFLDSAIHNYDQDRNFLGQDGTAQISPYLRFGMLSIHQAYHQANDLLLQTTNENERKGIQTWINELIWREFFNHILYHFPFVLKKAYYENKRNIQWEYKSSHLERWKAGKTGYPIVDACMRQLSGMKWMHNRGRMITASFLVKDLLINWQDGEKWFMENLVDGDPAANNGGWQWSAGVGTDAAPYFRIFNPVTQSIKFDPQGEYIRTWVPELRQVPDKYIHTPWEMPETLQKALNCRIGIDYPEQIVDHQEAKQKTLAAFRGMEKK